MIHLPQHISDGRHYIIAAVLVLLLSPIFLSKTLPTTDGFSHIYNATITADLLDHNRTSYDLTHTIRRPIAANRATWFAATILGTTLGFDDAHRLIIILLSTGIFVSWILYAHTLIGPAPRPSILITSIGGWLSTSWFLWMGFYDFTLSCIFLFVLSTIVTQADSWYGEASIQLLIGALYLSHLFTLGVGIGLIIWVAVIKRNRAWHILRAAPGILLIIVEIATAAITTGGIAWTTPLKTVVGTVGGVHFVSLGSASVAAALLIVTYFWWHIARELLSHNWSLSHLQYWPHKSNTVPVSYGLILIIGSLFAPDAIGEGSYIPTRLAYLGVGLAFPWAASSGRASFGGIDLRKYIGILLVGFLTLHSWQIIKHGEQINKDFHGIKGALNELGARPGDWTMSSFVDDERGLFRISGYTHLLDKINYNLSLQALDNYEARLSAFPVAYTAQAPNGRLWRRGDTLHVSISNDQPIPETVFVIYEGSTTLVSDFTRLVKKSSTSYEGFAVTKLTRNIRYDGRSDCQVR